VADDWRPSQYKPRGGWRAMLPDWRVALTALAVAAAIATKFFFYDSSSHDVSFKLMTGLVAVGAMACVAPHRFSAKPSPKPGQFPTERNDERTRTVDDKDA
jgi:hypothetical protein